MPLCGFNAGCPKLTRQLELLILFNFGDSHELNYVHKIELLFWQNAQGGRINVY